MDENQFNEINRQLTDFDRDVIRAFGDLVDGTSKRATERAVAAHLNEPDVFKVYTSMKTLTRLGLLMSHQ